MTKIAIIHDWLTGMRGGEAVLEAITEIFPPQTLFTLISAPHSVSQQLTRFPIQTSVLQKLPQASLRYRYFLPLMPWAIERFDLTGYDLILSSSHCVAKGIYKPPSAVHVSYIHAPMRYVWDRFDDYFGPEKSSRATRTAATLLRKRLQSWDRRTAQIGRTDHLIANSHFIAEQIEKSYGRASQVIYPFVNLDRFGVLPREPSASYLMVGAFAPYKRIDLAIEAFNHLKLPLQIVGSGQEEKKLRTLAGPTIEFLGPVSNEKIAELYSRCRAFVFPGVEDFGITPLEALASGTPVIALEKGGVAETVTRETGIFFKTQSLESLIHAVQQMEIKYLEFSESECRKRAALFSKKRFQSEFFSSVESAWIAAGKNPDSLLEVTHRFD